MKSPLKNDDADLDMDVAFRWTAEESARHEALGPPRLTMSEYFDWLESLPPPTLEQLRSKPGPRGEPFRLTF